MKCTNCGAEMQNGDKVRFCPYCGHQVERTEKMPKTMSGAIYGIAKGVIDEASKRFDYTCIHADEIEERKKKREREALKQGFIILLVATVLVGSIIAFTMHMAGKEKVEQKTTPVNITYAYRQDLA